MKIVSLGIKRVSYPDLILDWLFLDCGALSTAESSSLADGSNLEPAVDGRVDFSERKLFSICLAVVGRALSMSCDDFAVL